VHVRVCVCVCVRARARERERDTDRDRQTEIHTREIQSMYFRISRGEEDLAGGEGGWTDELFIYIYI
jgi:hypothetical protein